jgi:hypothetical protein
VIVRPFPIAPGQITAADLAENGEADALPSSTGVYGETLPEIPQ